jgi:arabinose-5-phosphate isomerase
VKTTLLSENPAPTFWADAAIIEEGRRVINAEAAALGHMQGLLSPSFATGVRAIADCSGRIVTTAIGKSGVIAQKIASTMSSLGCASHYVHPSEGMHGDLGKILPGDVLIAISHSGNSDELIDFLSAVRLRCEPTIIGIVGARGGALDEYSTVLIETGVTEEACALGLAPTTSSTAALAIGDALAVAASRVKGFRPSEFATLHPSGTLGDKLRMPIERLMRTDYPLVKGDASVREAVEVMTSSGIGLVIVDDGPNNRFGIITDGDIRRATLSPNEMMKRRSADMMSTPPRSIKVGVRGVDALMEMEKERVMALLVLDDFGLPTGIVHIHDILRFGLGLERPPSKALKGSKSKDTTTT